MLQTVKRFFPRKVRIALGVVLVVVGLPLFVLPIPLGIVFIAPGVALLVGSSSRARRLLVRFGRKRPEAYSKLMRLIGRGVRRVGKPAKSIGSSLVKRLPGKAKAKSAKEMRKQVRRANSEAG